MGEPIIRLADVEKSYGSGAARTEVLRGVSLDVYRGEILALVGQSGSGKSTLLNIVGGLDDKDGGSVEVLGLDFETAKETELARMRNERIGFIFQSFNLLDHVTCIDNVTMPSVFAPGGEDAHDRAMAALERVGLADLSHRYPTELSGGQKQRVAIARALFNKPELLLCDEPTGNLDSETGASVIKFFRELNERDNVTLVIVTHEERVSEVATRVLRITDGLIEGGTDVPESELESESESEPEPEPAVPEAVSDADSDGHPVAAAAPEAPAEEKASG